MRKGYRYFVAGSKLTNEKRLFLGLAPEYESIGEVIVLFENDEHFEKKKIILSRYNDSPIRIVEYSNAEMNKADFFYLELSNQKGYPSPEKSYLRDIFGNSFINENIQIFNQVNDVAATDIPKQITGLFGMAWLPSLIFCDILTYEKYIKPLDIQCRRVMDGNRKKVRDNIVQLLPEGVANDELKTDHERIKLGSQYFCKFDYHIHFSGYAPVRNRLNFFLTKELFLSIKTTYRMPIISKSFYEVLQKNKIKGARFYPFIN